MNFRANLIYGLLVLAPAGIGLLVLAKTVQLLRDISEPMAKVLGVESSVLMGLAEVTVALALLLAACLIAGSFVRSSLGSWSFELVEEKLLSAIPGYSVVGNLLKGFAGEEVEQLRAVRVDLYGSGSLALGFIMDELEDGSLVVFTPIAPTPTVGQVHIVAPERVDPLPSAIGVTQAISQWGLGMRRAFEQDENETTES